jgi:hypothetical protein
MLSPLAPRALKEKDLGSFVVLHCPGGEPLRVYDRQSFVAPFVGCWQFEFVRAVLQDHSVARGEKHELSIGEACLENQHFLALSNRVLSRSARQGQGCGDGEVNVAASVR